MIKLRLSAQKQVIVLTDMVIGEPEWLTGHSNTSVTVKSVSCGKLRITGKGLKLILKRRDMKEGLLLLGIEFHLELRGRHYRYQRMASRINLLTLPSFMQY